ncbi:MAG: phosphoribosylformylglycinamidine cyclo-ligase [Longimicrobiales bacterium]
MKSPTELSYRAAGVDRDAAAGAKRRILDLVASTAVPGVVANPGGFGGLFRAPSGMREPLLVASADSVGTKVKVAVRARRHVGVGQDIVNHCVNDILVEGARPLFFLDYIGMGRLEAGVVEQIVDGAARACRENGCALLGGETAELPDVYGPGEYDLAGFVVGVVESDARPAATRVRSGDALIAIASDGFHTNGYALLRRLLFDQLGLDVEDRFPGTDRTVADVLLRPHRSYLGPVAPLIEAGHVHAISHITGGGIPGNLERVIPADLCAIVELATWSPPEEFRSVQAEGRIAGEEMFRTFNMGAGMILVVAPESAGAVAGLLESAGERAWHIGQVGAGDHGVRLV